MLYNVVDITRYIAEGVICYECMLYNTVCNYVTTMNPLPPPLPWSGLRLASHQCQFIGKLGFHCAIIIREGHGRHWQPCHVSGGARSLTEHTFFFATDFKASPLFCTFLPQPSISLPHTPLFSPLNYSQRSFFTPMPHKPFGTNAATVHHGTSPPRPNPPTRLHPAPPCPTRPLLDPPSLAAWTPSGATQPPASASSASRPRRPRRIPPAAR
jgi:hypothetical protein